MTTLPPRHHIRARRAVSIANWLALLALLSLGVVWPAAESMRPSENRAALATRIAQTPAATGAAGTPQTSPAQR